MAIVYTLKCAKTSQVRYVGEGGETRPFDHVRKVRKGLQTSNPRLSMWIRKLLEQELEPLIEVVNTGLSKAEALEKEHALIMKYGRVGFEKNGTLLNISERGREYDRTGSNNPFFGRKHTEETLTKMSETKRGKKRGEKFSETMREVAARRPPISEATRKKMRESMLGKKQSTEAILKQKETKRKNRKRKFIGKAPSGEVHNFTSVWEFASETKLPGNSIYKLIETGQFGKRGSLRGWSFSEVLIDAGVCRQE